MLIHFMAQTRLGPDGVDYVPQPDKIQMCLPRQDEVDYEPEPDQD